MKEAKTTETPGSEGTTKRPDSKTTSRTMNEEPAAECESDSQRSQIKYLIVIIKSLFHRRPQDPTRRSSDRNHRKRL